MALQLWKVWHHFLINVRCIKKRKCSAWIHVTDDKIVNALNENNHSSDVQKVEVEKLCETICMQMDKTTHFPNVILNYHLLLRNVVKLLQIKFQVLIS